MSFQFQIREKGKHQARKVSFGEDRYADESDEGEVGDGETVGGITKERDKASQVRHAAASDENGLS